MVKRFTTTLHIDVERVKVKGGKKTAHNIYRISPYQPANVCGCARARLHAQNTYHLTTIYINN